MLTGACMQCNPAVVPILQDFDANIGSVIADMEAKYLNDPKFADPDEGPKAQTGWGGNKDRKKKKNSTKHFTKNSTSGGRYPKGGGSKRVRANKGPGDEDGDKQRLFAEQRRGSSVQHNTEAQSRLYGGNQKIPSAVDMRVWRGNDQKKKDLVRLRRAVWSIENWWYIIRNRQAWKRRGLDRLIVVAVIGQPLTGKSTVAQALADKHDMTVLSLKTMVEGEALHAKVHFAKTRSLHGAWRLRRAEELVQILEDGEVVPVQWVVDLIFHAIYRTDFSEAQRGFVLDGLPCTRNEAYSLQDRLCSPKLVMSLRCALRDVVDRAGGPDAGDPVLMPARRSFQRSADERVWAVFADNLHTVNCGTDATLASTVREAHALFDAWTARFAVGADIVCAATLHLKNGKKPLRRKSGTMRKRRGAGRKAPPATRGSRSRPEGPLPRSASTASVTSDISTMLRAELSSLAPSSAVSRSSSALASARSDTSKTSNVPQMHELLRNSDASTPGTSSVGSSASAGASSASSNAKPPFARRKNPKTEPTHRQMGRQADKALSAGGQNPTDPRRAKVTKRDHDSSIAGGPGRTCMPAIPGVSSGDAGGGGRPVRANNRTSHAGGRVRMGRPDGDNGGARDDGRDERAANDARNKPPDELPYFYRGLGRLEAEALLFSDDGRSCPGKFLIRAKRTAVNNAVLSVVSASGKVIHSLLERKATDAEYMLKRTPTGATSLVAVIELLFRKQLLGIPILTAPAKKSSERTGFSDTFVYGYQP